MDRSKQSQQHEDQSSSENQLCAPEFTSPQWKINSSDWVDKDSYYHKQLILYQNKINANNKFAYVFGSFVLSGKFKITVKIEYMQLFIGVGVSDVENVRKSGLQDYYLRYNCTGQFYEYGKLLKNVDEFKIGDQICLICANDGNIQFYKNQSLAITFEVNNNIKLVPFICLSYGDSVSIVDSFCQIQLLSVFFAQRLFMWDEDILYELGKLIDLTDPQVQN